MLDYNTIKENPDKNIQVKRHSADAWKLGEIVSAVGYVEDKSEFTFTSDGRHMAIDSGNV